MATPPTPSIACIGVIGKQDNPLHVALFPPHTANPSAQLDFSFILNSALDIFDLRARDKSRVDQDLGLLHAVDERLSVWGWETGTGTKFVIVLDMWGREGVEGTGLGIREAELKPAFRALQTAYIKLLQNPFYTPDEHGPNAAMPGVHGGSRITSRKFAAEVQRIGTIWKPGVTQI